MSRLFTPGLFYVFLALAIAAVLVMSGAGRNAEPARRVVLIGIDGMGVSGFEQAVTPHLDSLVRRGAISVQTRGVMPTVSAPNWASHLMGAGPEQHGVTSNGWSVDTHSIEPAATDGEGYFPSLFTIIHEQRPGAATGFFYDWQGLADLLNPSSIAHAEFTGGFEATFSNAASWIIREQPAFTFVYAGHPDMVGHSHGWGSPAYLRALEDVDRAVGAFLGALGDAGVLEHTHVLVVSDHGGQGRGHGGVSMEELLTPWIVAGPGIIRDRVIEQPNDIVNTAPTIARLLGMEVPEAWTGRPVLGAFQYSAAAMFNTRAFVNRPTPSLPGGMYDESMAVAFEVSNPEVAIRYTVDGSDPTPRSPVYKSPVLLQKTGTLKAAGSVGDDMSEVVKVEYVRVLKVRDVKLSEPPDEKYAGRGAWTLADRATGGSSFGDGGWLGFSGRDLEALITLDDRSTLSRCSVGILNDPGSWIFPPESVEVQASVDGITFVTVGALPDRDAVGEVRKGRSQLRVKIKPAQARYLKVIVRNTGTCPPDHPGAGEPAWLFVDEIILE